MKEKDISRIMDAIEKVRALSFEAGKMHQRVNALEIQAAQMMDTVANILRADKDETGGDHADA